MSQLTIYLPEDLHKKILTAAKAKDLSTSKWVAEILKREVDESWPEEIKQMVGAWQDFPSQEEIRNSMGKDLLREQF